MMKTLYLTVIHSLRERFVEWRSSLVASMLLVLAVIAVVACGGGGSVASVGSGGTGTVSASTYNVGTVTGFGSVFVNGVRFEDSSASVSDEDGARSRNDLKLGMVVKVQGSVDASGTATASSFSFDSELLGPVSTINTASKTFTIIGQKVLADASTVFDNSLPQGLASVQTGQVLEVHGFLNASTNELQASLVELKSNPDRFKISGNVSNLQSASKTFQIGLETISFAGLSATDIAPVLANGVLVKVRLAPSAPGTGVPWTAARLRNSHGNVGDSDKAEVEGLVTSITSTALFSVSGVAVDARNASFSNGSAGLVLGARAEVEGTLVNGTLIATEVKLQTTASGGKEIELNGTLSGVSSSSKTFVLRGVTVSYSNVARYDNGSETDLANGKKVEVKGQATPNSSVVSATRIKFGD
jgi:Domain of unknown function (DUF5666)